MWIWKEVGKKLRIQGTIPVMAWKITGAAFRLASTPTDIWNGHLPNTSHMC